MKSKCFFCNLVPLPFLEEIYIIIEAKVWKANLFMLRSEKRAGKTSGKLLSHESKDKRDIGFGEFGFAVREVDLNMKQQIQKFYIKTDKRFNFLMIYIKDFSISYEKVVV